MARQQIFNAADVAGAGLAVVRRAGWAAISFRSVADELHLSPMALYRVVADAASLRRLIADAAAIPVTPEPEPLPDALRTWAVNAYGESARYPGLAAYVIGEWTELPAWLDIVESLLGRAVDAGFDGPAGVAQVNAVFAFVLSRGQLRDAAATQPRRRLRPLSDHPRRYPLMQQNRSEFAVAQTDKHFVFGLDSILGAILR